MPNMMNRVIRRFISICGLCIMSSSNSFGNAQTLPEAIEYALNNQPSIKQARANLNIVDEELSQARAAFRPQVSAQASISAAQRNSSLPGGFDFDVFTRPVTISAFATQTLYAGGRRGIAKERARFSIQAAEARFADTQRQVVLQAGEAFFDVLLAGDLLLIRQDITKLLESQFITAENSFELGSVRRHIKWLRFRQAL